MSRSQTIAVVPLLLVPLMCGLATPSCLATDEFTRFERPEAVRGSQHAGAAPLEQSFGGLYVYRDSVSPGNALPPTSRLIVGPRPMSQFTLLSAEEEAAMWALRERQHSAVVSASIASPTFFGAAGRGPRSHRGGHSGADACGPRVVEREDKTCVPDLAHSDAPDWRDHLVCWVKQQRTVEVQPEGRHE